MKFSQQNARIRPYKRNLSNVRPDPDGSLGGGYDPEDIAEAGEEVTHSFIKVLPGFKANRWSPSLKVVSWVGGIVAVVAAAGLVKWLGWA